MSTKDSSAQPDVAAAPADPLDAMMADAAAIAAASEVAAQEAKPADDTLKLQEPPKPKGVPRRPRTYAEASPTSVSADKVEPAPAPDRPHVVLSEQTIAEMEAGRKSIAKFQPAKNAA